MTESMPRTGCGETKEQALHRCAWNLLAYIDGPMSFNLLDIRLLGKLRTACNEAKILGQSANLATAARAVLSDIDTKYPHSESAHLHTSMMISLEAALEPFESTATQVPHLDSWVEWAESNDIEHDDQSVRQGTSTPPREDIYARAAKAILGTPTKFDLYTRVTLTDDSVTWLKQRMSMLKLDLLIEKKRMLKDRGADTTKYALILAGIEQDLREINVIVDALS
jgi:hypothetical protein